MTIIIRGHPLNDYMDEAGNPVQAVRRDDGTWVLTEETMTGVQEKVAAALMPLGIAAENVSSMGNADQWVPDRDAARQLTAALASVGVYLVDENYGCDCHHAGQVLLLRELADMPPHERHALIEARLAALPESVR